MAKNPLTGLYYESDPRLKVSTLGFRPLGYANGGFLGSVPEEEYYRENMDDPTFGDKTQPEFPSPVSAQRTGQDDDEPEYEWRGGPEGTGTGYPTGLRSRPGTRGAQGGPSRGPFSPEAPLGKLFGFFGNRVLNPIVQTAGDVVSGAANLGGRALGTVTEPTNIRTSNQSARPERKRWSIDRGPFSPGMLPYELLRGAGEVLNPIVQTAGDVVSGFVGAGEPDPRPGGPQPFKWPPGEQGTGLMPFGDMIRGPQGQDEISAPWWKRLGRTGQAVGMRNGGMMGFRPLGYTNGGSVNNDGSSYGMSEAGQITEDEGGNKAKTYMDEVPQRNGTIKKVLTGGIGHKLTEAEQDLYREGTEVPPEIRAAWFKSDMEKARTIADSLLPSGGSPELHRILVNMAFNLGDTGIREFTGMLGAINAGDFTRAALEMRYVEPTGRKRAVISKKTPDGTSEETLEETLEETPWWLQTGGRAQRLVDRMYGLVIPRRRPVDPTVPRTGKDVRRLFEEQLPILDGPLPIPTVQPPNDVHREDGASDQAIEDQRMRILGDVRLSDQAIGNFRGMRNGGIMTLRRY